MFVSPQETLKQIEIKKDMTVADLGSGSGGWTLPLAKIVTQGRVLAVDLQEEPLSALSGEAKAQGLRNVAFIVADIENIIPGVFNESCDLVLITNVLFQTDDKQAVLKEASRILKPSGELLVVDWKPEATFGPKGNKISVPELRLLAKNVGLSLEKELEAEVYHYALLFKKA